MDVFQKYDTDQDGFLTLQELRQDLSTNRPVQLNSMLTRKLDINFDGKLSGDEIDQSPHVLRTFDRDNDGILSRQELVFSDSGPPAKTTWMPGEHQTEHEIKNLCYGCDAFKLVHGRYPNSLSEMVELPTGSTIQKWRGPFVKELPAQDSWGNSLKYDLKGVVSSAGRDGQWDTQDDIQMRVDQTVRRQAIDRAASRTYSKMRGLLIGCQQYKRQHGEFPASLLALFETPPGMSNRQGRGVQWKGPFVSWPKQELKDSWDNPFIHEVDEENDQVTIRSCGPDEVAATVDDIVINK